MIKSAARVLLARGAPRGAGRDGGVRAASKGGGLRCARASRCEPPVRAMGQDVCEACVAKSATPVGRGALRCGACGSALAFRPSRGRERAWQCRSPACRAPASVPHKTLCGWCDGEALRRASIEGRAMDNRVREGLVEGSALPCGRCGSVPLVLWRQAGGWACAGCRGGPAPAAQGRHGRS